MSARDKYEIQLMRENFIDFHQVQLTLKRNLTELKSYSFDGLKPRFFVKCLFKCNSFIL